MNRRQYCTGIATLAVAAVSGCLTESANSPDGNDPGENESDGTDSSLQSQSTPRPDDARREIELLDVTEIPDDVPLSASLDVRWPWITTDRTAALELEVTNEGESRIETTPLYHNGASSQASEPGTLVTESRSALQRSDPPTIDGECWEDPKPSVPAPSFGTENPGLELDPGESKSFALVVSDDPSVEGCFPTGEYRFEQPNHVAGTEFGWGFSLAVHDVSE